ncbi:hypothetical protein [Kitasatospora sp. NPDC051164]|uniref:hypothetical protein n=1 Tax=Kitasatospora sp. NPDC051164 TaxID=3364055 RepID=UPI0037AE3EEB
MTNPTAVELGCAGAGCTNSPTVQWRRRSGQNADSTDAVHACNQHAIGLELAAHVHAAGCTAPDPAKLPGCGCAPEPIPNRQPQQPATPELPPTWAGQTAPAA